MAGTLRALGRIDGCFANAGVSGRGMPSFLEMSAEEWRRVLKVNLDGAFYTFRAAARHMVERGGGDLMVDEPVSGSAPIAPDEPDFVLPTRKPSESIASYIKHIEEAAARAGHKGRAD